MECISALELIEETNPDACILTGFNDAIIGVCKRFGQSPILCYDYDTCIEILMDEKDIEEEFAQNYFEDYILGSWMGDGTPAFLVRTGED